MSDELAWAYALLVVGAVMQLVCLFIVARARQRARPHKQKRGGPAR